MAKLIFQLHWSEPHVNYEWTLVVHRFLVYRILVYTEYSYQFGRMRVLGANDPKRSETIFINKK